MPPQYYAAPSAPIPQQQPAWPPPTAETAAAGAYSLRNGQTRRCPYCASTVPAAAVACPVCRSDLQARPHQVRCRQCGGKAPGNLALCPHCGVELRAAPPRWLTVLVPALLLVMILALIAVAGAARGEAAGFTGPLVGMQAWFAGLSEGLDPQVAVIPPAAPPALSDALTTDAGTTGAATTGAATDGSGTSGDALAAGGFAEGAAGGVAITDTLATTGTGVTSGTLPVDTGGATTDTIAAVSQPAAPVESPTVAATPVPTQAPTQVPTPAATTPLLTHTVQPGDTALGIAERYGIALDRLLAANGLNEESATLLQQGQTLTIPSTPAPVAADPNVTPVPGTPYTVRQGDTLVGISVRLGVPMEAIMAANGLTADEATQIRPDDVLIIPDPTPTPAPPTATPAPATPTPE
ncbi:MAG: LysM peptidoglycan-binding domain-containing protein, partial [Caldilineaceae bacterium]